MKQRATVRMPDAEVAAVLEAGRKVQVATINPDGTPHLVTMFYGLRDGEIAFWTYRDSQKARNLRRDPRLTCLVEDGDDYFELRGVQVSGVARLIDDLPGVTAVGKLVAARMPGSPPPEALQAYVERAAAKRVAYLVEALRTVSWDHRRLVT